MPRWFRLNSSPTLGSLGPRSARHGFIRNFLDNDQRPLGDIIRQPGPPLLILHGVRDPLVPVATARAHHTLVPGSRLVIYDSDHFLPFREHTATMVADDLITFTATVDAGDEPSTATLTVMAATPLDRLTFAPSSFAGRPFIAAGVVALTVIAGCWGSLGQSVDRRPGVGPVPRPPPARSRGSGCGRLSR